MGAFHAYDIRGIWNVDWDEDVAYKVGFFVPELLGTDKVLLGRDCRLSSDTIHDAVIRGVTDAGADIYDIGLITISGLQTTGSRPRFRLRLHTTLRNTTE